jgi:hypothetical protein
MSLSRNEWTEVLSIPGRWQVRGNKPVFFIEAAEQPVGLDNYFIGRPGVIHHFSQQEVSLWIYSKRSGSTIAIDVPKTLDVFVQDQTTAPLDLYFIKQIETPTTLAAPTVEDTNSITVTTDANMSVGDYIGIFSGTSLEGRFYFAEILTLPGANVVTVDSPLDFAFDAGDPVIITSRDLNVNGSSTPEVFVISGAGTGSPITIDITRILIEIQTDSAVDLSKFGDIATGLTKGIVLRRNNDEITNIFNAKTNAELANLAYDWTPFAASNPVFGKDGFVWRYTFAGNDKHGVAVRLYPNETLELVIQDDLSTLDSFRIIAAGHVVQL